LLGAFAAAQPLTSVGPLHRPAGAVEVRAPMPASFRLNVSTPAPFRLGAIRPAELDSLVRNPQLPMMGIERSLDRAAQNVGEWLALEDGGAVWRMTVQSDGASGVRVHFRDFAVGRGSVWVYSEDRSQVYGPYTGSGIDDSGDFWSHTVFAETAVVEYLAEQRTETVPFSVNRVAHLLASEQTMSAGSCELDVMCYSPWAGIASGVGMYIFQSGGGTYACSGSLVNNSANDAKPYFLTANHCISTQAMAQTVEVFWKYQSASCNGAAPSLSASPTTLGATYLASAPMASGDFSLMLLGYLPNNSLTFYGWNSSATALGMSGPVVGMHHPQADYTRVVFGQRAADATVQIGSDIAPASMFYQVRTTAGVIEAGSSGSPLFTPDELVVGTLTYGPSGNACSISPFVAGYARFSAAYPSLSKYLSPTGTSGVTVTPSPTSVSAAWTIGAAAPAAQSVQLSTASTSPVALTAVANQSWIGLSAASFSVSSSKTSSLSVTLNTAPFTLAGTYNGSIALTGTGVSISIPVQVTVAAAAAIALVPAPSSLTVGWTIGTTPPVAQTIQLSTASTPAVALTAKASQTWIGLGSASVSVSLSKPAILSVSLNTASFTTAAAYTGTITLTGTGVSVSIPVQVNVSAASTVTTVTPAPTSLGATWTIGSSAPANQSVQLSTASTAAVSLTVKANQSWIMLSAASLSVSQAKPATLSVALSTSSFTAAGQYSGAIAITGTNVSITIPVLVTVNASATVVTGGQSTLIPFVQDGSDVATSFSLVNPYATSTVASLAFFSATGAPAAIATGSAAAAAWQNLTIPAYGTVIITTTGTSSPQKQAFAIVTTGDATKRLAAVAQVGLDLVAPSAAVTPPFVVPFDATSTAATTLYIFNPATSGSVSLGLAVYNTAGTLLGSGTIVVPAQQQGTVAMSKTASVFAGQKGTLLITGSAPVWSMGVRVDSGGRIDMVPPQAH
jgi:hypothetical protein